MKRIATISVSIAAASLISFLPQFTLAQGTANSQPASGQTAQASAQREAMQMVPAEVALTGELDARKVEPGYKFQTTLQDKVQLKNGPELPRGTVLMGNVVTDKMQAGGASRLALRFTSAELKDGKRIPIEAMIVGVDGPAYDTAVYGYEFPGTAADVWNSKTLKMDVIGVESGVDLRSSIGGKNSGVFVLTEKSDVKFAEGSRITLAIAARTGGNSSGTGGA